VSLSVLLEPLVFGPYERRQIELMVGWLAPEVRALLACGPICEHHEQGDCCRVCVAFRPMKRWAQAWLDAHPDAEPDAEIPMSPGLRRRFSCTILLAEWHQGDDLARYGVEPGGGEIVFERCLAIYRAAGWDG
jgi:hypothetical protein